MLDIVRRNAVRQFLPSDLYFLKVVGPIMSRALEASLARERAMRETSSLAHAQASGVLLVSPSRKIEFATPAGEAWLKLLHDAGRDGHAPLLTPVWSAIAGLTASGREHFVSSVTAQTMRGPVRVEASPAGEEGRIAVVLAPIQPPEPPSIPISWELTAQERRVVECLLRGMTNQQISASLFVTENTVEAHLRSIYTKLDVRSRLELLARLFRETGWASFDFGNEGR